MARQYILASDFDKTLSFNDSGDELAELIGAPGFTEKVAGLSRINLVQQGAELAYLILHDPDFRRVTRTDLIAAGKRIRLKQNVALFAQSLNALDEEYRFHFCVISAAPQEIVQSALDGIVPPDRIFGTRFEFDDASGQTRRIIRASAGWGKVAVLEEVREKFQVGPDRVIYVGDGSSDLPVMMHVNQDDGLTIA